MAGELPLMPEAGDEGDAAWVAGEAGDPGSAVAGSAVAGSAVAAGEFTECTFLFAKIVGLRVLTDDETRDPQEVVEVLQVMMIASFDHLDEALTASFNHTDEARMTRCHDGVIVTARNGGPHR